MEIEIPDDLTGLSIDQLNELRDKIRDTASELRNSSSYSSDDVELIDKVRDAADTIKTEYSRRKQVDNSRSELGSILDDALGEEPSNDAPDVEEPATPVAEEAPQETVTEVDDRQPVAASIQALKPHATTDSPPQTKQRRAYAMIAASGLPKYEGGKQLEENQFGDAISQRLQAHAKGGVPKAGDAVITNRKNIVAQVTRPDGKALNKALRMGNTTSQRVVQIKHQEAASYGLDPVNNYLVAQEDSASWARGLTEKRQSLLHNPEKNWQPKNLVAAGFRCGPGESIWDVCLQASDNGMLPLPSRVLNRGTVTFSDGYDFGDILDATAGMRQDCDQQDAGEAKICAEVPCATTTDACAPAYYVCLTSGLLQRRAWPESIDAYARGVLLALQHNKNAGIIQQIVDGSDDGGVMTTCADDDAFASIMGAVLQAAADLRQHSYLGDNGVEVILPMWARDQMQYALLRRRAVDDPVKAYAWIDTAFASIDVTVHWVYGWQDAHFTDPPDGLPGGDTPGTGLPTEVDFVIYPSGTWAEGTLDVINLDTIYDSSGLQNNTYTALFAEFGAVALKLCPNSRVYTVTADPCGCGCATGSV